MQMARDHYRITRELSSTLFGRIVVCEIPRETVKSTPAASSVVMKQVSLERMANIVRDLPSDGHIPDNPLVEKEMGDLFRAAGGHPNLVQYKDSFLEQQTLHLVMEHCSPLVSLASTSVKSFRTLKQAGITVVIQAWGVTSVSDTAVHLLSGMLEIDPQKRLTVAQVLEHDALNSDCTKITRSPKF
ncbi:hypothetical protein PF005_g24669 [Phytophthora fragariae]|uniref:Protein kinase domain-containing protein n=1 Tax=Phytophthora fragariae TaxID=53985 RepID=A0A6A3W5Y0_9STRA|nr:hypothetical protein PF005_g24669 [Phytophthora fragariae]